MELKITAMQITVGADRHNFGDCTSWKMWKGDDGKTYLKVVPEQGKHEMYEVEPHLTFRDVDGNVVEKVDYYIVTWRKGMARPECVIRVGDATGKGTFEQEEPEPEKKKKKGRGHDFAVQTEGEDDGA